MELTFTAILYLAFSQVSVGPGDLVKSIAPGDGFTLERNLLPEHTTLFVFFQPAVASDQSTSDSVIQRTNSMKSFGLRLVPLRSLDVPVADMYGIRETPTFMVLDRFGNLLLRTNKMEEVGKAVSRGIKMARIKWVDEQSPEAAKTYQMMGGGRGGVPEIIKTMSLRPDLMEAIMQLSRSAHFSDGFLPRRTKEMIATYVSAINKCKY